VPIRFYVDADLIGLAKILQQVRTDVTYPGDPGGTAIDGLRRDPCSLRPDTPEPEWIPHVAAQAWPVITRDRHMQHRPAEKAMIHTHEARHFHLDAKRQLDRWGQLEIVVSRCETSKRVAELPGPWIYMVTRSGQLRKQL
jgi:uncharacterized protein with PIN domain